MTTVTGLKSKSVLITGGGRGIGEAIAYAFAKEGSNLYLSARTVSELEFVQKKIKGSGVKCFIQKCDVSKYTEVENWIKNVIKEFGTVDVLVNNAGVYGPIGPLADNDLHDWVKTIEINLIGSLNCLKAVLPHMIKQKSGVVINLSGGGALAPFPRFSAYGTSKAAIVRLTETVSEEVKEYNIRVNAISPGAVNTRILDEAIKAGEACGKDFLKKCKKQKEAGGTPPELAADLAVFLASDESKGVTGKVISALWDDWKNIPAKIQSLNGTALYTMRRIDDRNFKEVK